MSILNKIYKTGSSIGHSLTYFIDMFMISNLVLRKFMVSTFVNRDNIDFVSYLEIKIKCKKDYIFHINQARVCHSGLCLIRKK